MDEETLTGEEREQMDETPDETPEEAHRVGEFRELRDLLDEVLSEVRAMRSDIGSLRGIAIDSGAELRDDAVDEAEDAAEEAVRDVLDIPDYDELDFSM